MIFLPNKFERFLSALRVTVQNRILEKGITKKSIENLEKISLAEAIYYKDFKEPVDIFDFSLPLLISAFTVSLNERKIIFDITATGNYILNPKLFEILILSLCKTASKIKIETIRQKIIIKANTKKNKTIQKIINALNGICFYEDRKTTLFIALPFEKTDKKAIKIKREWEYLNDPFSLVNIFLS